MRIILVERSREGRRGATHMAWSPLCARNTVKENVLFLHRSVSLHQGGNRKRASTTWSLVPY